MIHATRAEKITHLLTQALLHAAKQRFGASSEKTPQINGQYLLFDEEIIENTVEPASPVINIKKRKVPVSKKGDREKAD